MLPSKEPVQGDGSLPLPSPQFVCAAPWVHVLVLSVDPPLAPTGRQPFCTPQAIVTFITPLFVLGGLYAGTARSPELQVPLGPPVGQFIVTAVPPAFTVREDWAQVREVPPVLVKPCLRTAARW